MRLAKRWTRVDLACKTSMKANVIARIERGRRRLRILTVAKIARVLGITTAMLMRKAKL